MSLWSSCLKHRCLFTVNSHYMCGTIDRGFSSFARKRIYFRPRWVFKKMRSYRFCLKLYKLQVSTLTRQQEESKITKEYNFLVLFHSWTSDTYDTSLFSQSETESNFRDMEDGRGLGSWSIFNPNLSYSQLLTLFPLTVIASGNPILPTTLDLNTLEYMSIWLPE